MRNTKLILYIVLIPLLIFLFSNVSLKIDVYANPSDSPNDWSMFQHDLNKTGYSNSSAPDKNFTLWSYTTGYWIYSSPAVSNGRVYIGSDDHNLYCLNASTGAKIWNYPTGSAGVVVSSPAIAYGRVYFGSNDLNIYCLNASTGTKIWNYVDSYVTSSPTVADGKVYIGSQDYNIYCLDAFSGTKIWSYKAGNTVWSSPAIVDGKVYIGSRDGNVYAFGTLTSSNNIQVGGTTYSTPITSNSMVTGFSFDQSAKKISFNTTGTIGTVGFCNITIIKALLGGPYTVLKDGSPVTLTETSNATHSFLYFTYTQSIHNIEIIGTTAIPEFPTMIATTLLLTALTVILIFKERKVIQY